MSRAIWSGNISFGLISIDVDLFTAITPNKIPLHMIDRRDGSKIKYVRINENTGEEVPWDEIAKSYEFEKNNYVPLDKELLENFKPELTKTIDLEEFVPLSDLSVLLFDKPYYLVPSKRSQKAYVLLHETLIQQNKCGIGRVVIKTKQHLAAIFPLENALVLNLLFFPEEVKPINDFSFPEIEDFSEKIKSKEIELSSELIESMTTQWDPAAYVDDYNQKLRDWIEEEISGKHTKKRKPSKDNKKDLDNVINIEELLKKSLKNKKVRKTS